MAFDFDNVFQDALGAGIAAARPGGQAAEAWIHECALENESTLRAIAEGAQSGQISKETASMLLRENARAMEAEAAALSVMIKASAQVQLAAIAFNMRRWATIAA